MEAFFDRWELIAALILLVSWFVRLEAKVKSLDDGTNRQSDMNQSIWAECKDLRMRQEALGSDTVHELAKVRESLAEIKGILSMQNSGNNNR